LIQAALVEFLWQCGADCPISAAFPAGVPPVSAVGVAPQRKPAIVTPIFVLNLDRAPTRWQLLAAGLEALGLGAERIAALDRLAPGADRLRAEFDAGRIGRDYPATMGDVCCSLTHQQLWQRIAGMSSGAVIVLEDDARLSPAFADLVRTDLGGLMRRHGIGALKLEHWPGGERSRRHPVGQRLEDLPQGGAALYRQAATFLGTCAYAITPEAAARLLTAHPKMGLPVDHYLFSRSAGRGFPLLAPAFLNPAPVLHDFVTHGSDILGERIASGLSNAPQTLRRRLREAVLRRRLLRGLRSGRLERVEMQWAGRD
jgi:GR25 family glycosyltransferase involved in LPS biosynthesis